MNLTFGQRLGAAYRMLRTKSMAEIVEHFRRVEGASAGGKNRPGKPYRQVPVVRAAIARKGKCLASMPLMVSTADDRIIETGPIVDLLERPNPRMSGRDFVNTTSAWLDLSGACHWVMLKETWDGPRPTEVIPVSAWQMKPVLNDDAELVGWRYRATGRRWDQAIQIGLDEVWTMGEDTFDPNDPFGYSAPLEAAGFAAAQLYKADLANEASLDNGVEPGGAFTMPGTPTDKQISDLREEVSDRHAGVMNRRRHLVLYGGIDWKQIASSFADMEFSTLQKMKIVDVCVVLEVDPAALGYYENSNYAHAEAAKAGMWLDTVLPRAAWMADEFDRGVIGRFEGDRNLTWRDGPWSEMRRAARPMSRRQFNASGLKSARARRRPNRALYTWFDDSAVPALRAAMLARSKEGAVWIEKYLQPPADVIESLDLPLPTYDHQKHGWKPMGLVPVDEPLPEEDDETGESPPPEEEPSPPEKGHRATDQGQRLLSDEQLAQLWRLWRTSWAPIERQMRGKVGRHFHDLRTQTLRRLEQALPEGKSVDDVSGVSGGRDIIAAVLFDLVEADKALLVKARPLMRAAYALGGTQSITEAAIAEGKPPEEATPFNIADPNTQTAMRRREIQLKGVNRTLRNRLRAQLAEGVTNQETTAQIAERVRKEFGFASARARTIAMTETGGAVEDARQLGREQASVPMKSWLWSRKETGRPWHMETEELTLAAPIPNDALFTLSKTGAQTPHPRGPNLTAEDAANCGCTTLSRYAGDGLRDLRMFAHLLTHGFMKVDHITPRTTSGGEAA